MEPLVVLLGAILWLWPPSILWRRKRDEYKSTLFYPDAKFRQMATTGCVVLRHTGQGEQEEDMKNVDQCRWSTSTHMRNLWLNWKTSIHMGDIWKVQQGTASFARHPDFISQAYFRSKLFCSCEAIHMHIGKVDWTQKWCHFILSKNMILLWLEYLSETC